MCDGYFTGRMRLHFVNPMYVHSVAQHCQCCIMSGAAEISHGLLFMTKCNIMYVSKLKVLVNVQDK